MTECNYSKVQFEVNNSKTIRNTKNIKSRLYTLGIPFIPNSYQFFYIINLKTCLYYTHNIIIYNYGSIK